MNVKGEQVTVLTILIPLNYHLYLQGHTCQGHAMYGALHP